MTTGCAIAKVDVLGAQVSAVDMATFLAQVEAAVAARTRLTVSFINPNYLMGARRHPRLIEQMNAYDLLLADGWGIVAGARLLGHRLPERMANDDIETPLFEAAAGHAWRIFLFGSAPGTAERAAATLTAGFPGIQVVGTMHGWLDVERGHPGHYDPDDNDRIVEQINAAAPDVLLVGLPTPMQQDWVATHLSRLDVPVVITGGSYLDHVAEHLQWYPRTVDRWRLGWLYRLARDPRRLWYRYSVELAHYGARLLLARARSSRPAPPEPAAPR